MTWIKLSYPTGRPVYVNLNHIVEMVRDGQDQVTTLYSGNLADYDGLTFFHIEVRETPEAIMKILEQRRYT